MVATAVAVVAAPTSVTAGIFPQSVVAVGTSAVIGAGTLAAIVLLALGIYTLREDRRPKRAGSVDSQHAAAARRNGGAGTMRLSVSPTRA